MEAQSADGNAVTLADTVLVAAAPRTPDFVLEQADLVVAAPQDNAPVQVQVSVRNDGATWTDGTPLELAAAWDAPVLAAQQAVMVSLPGLEAGQVANVTLTLPPLSGSPDADHTVFVTVNPRHTIDESNGANNDALLPVTGVSGPIKVYVAADPRDRLFNLRWTRRRCPSMWRGIVSIAGQPAGHGKVLAAVSSRAGPTSTPRSDTLYEYAVSAYTAAGFQSRLSLPMQAIMDRAVQQSSDGECENLLPLIESHTIGTSVAPQAGTAAQGKTGDGITPDGGRNQIVEPRTASLELSPAARRTADYANVHSRQPW